MSGKYSDAFGIMTLKETKIDVSKYLEITCEHEKMHAFPDKENRRIMDGVNSEYFAVEAIKLIETKKLFRNKALIIDVLREDDFIAKEKELEKKALLFRWQDSEKIAGEKRDYLNLLMLDWEKQIGYAFKLRMEDEE